MVELKNDPPDSISNEWKTQLLCKWPLAFWLRNNEQEADPVST